MNKKHIVVLLILFIHVTMFAVNDKQPNIIFILMDDHGYGDVTCYNKNSDISTPYYEQWRRKTVDRHKYYKITKIDQYGENDFPNTI